MLARCLPKWEAAMGACFQFELVVRLLAGKFFAGESGVNQDSCPKNRHRNGDAIGGTRTSCLTGLRYTAPTGDQLRVDRVQRRGVRCRAAVYTS